MDGAADRSADRMVVDFSLRTNHSHVYMNSYSGFGTDAEVDIGPTDPSEMAPGATSPVLVEPRRRETVV